MTQQEAKQLGRTKLLKVTGILVAIFLLILFFTETRGDFANGILFFMQAILNIHFITIVIILFGLTFLLGGKAGKEIIIENANPFVLSAKYALIIVLSIFTYVACIGIAEDSESTVNNLHRLLITYFLTPLVNQGLQILIPILLTWLWVTNRIKKSGQQKTW